MQHPTAPTAGAHLIPAGHRLTRAELAAASFLARYTGATRATYTLDLRIFFEWCHAQGLDVLDDVTRLHVELFSRYLEVDRGNAPVSIARRLSCVKSFYRCCEHDDVVAKSPAEHARMPKVYRDDVKILGLDRLELGSYLATARFLSPRHYALAMLLGVLGLRVTEACGVQIEDFAGTERGHRVLRLVGKGGKPATIPLPVPVLRALEDAAAGRTSGQLLHTEAGNPLHRHAATRMVQRTARRAGITKRISPHSLRHSMVTNALDAGVPLRDVQIAARHSDPRTTSRYDRARGNLDRHAVHTLAAYVAGAA